MTLAAPLAAQGADAPRHYELVSPVEKLGQEARLQTVSPDGQRVGFDSPPGNGFPGAPAYDVIRNGLIAQRTASGWESSDWSPSATEFVTSYNYKDLSPDHSAMLFRLSTPEQARNAETALYLRRGPTAPLERISPTLRNASGSASVTWLPEHAGATADFSHILLTLRRPGTLLSTELPTGSHGTISIDRLYELAYAGTPQATLRRVDIGNGGEELGGPCGAALGGVAPTGLRIARSLSADGRRIFFSAGPDGGGTQGTACGTEWGWDTPIKLFARVDGTSAVELSASECDRTPDPDAEPAVEPCAPAADALYESASDDGRRVWFTTRSQLVDGDVDGELDLYLYDFDAPSGRRLTQASSQTGGVAGVQHLVAAAADGSRAYFLATGVLANNQNTSGASAVEGQNNVYLYDVASRETTFVAAIDSAEGAQWDWAVERPVQLADDDGRVLVFSTSARLTVDDTDAVSDVFRFDAAEQSLVRVSTGQPGRGNADGGWTGIISVGHRNENAEASTLAGRTVSRDGKRIIFVTPEPLVDGDQDDAADVYEWYEGTTRLVSDGRAGRGQERFTPVAAISEDGSSVVFESPRQLLGQDRDTATDIYAARLGDDVKIPVEPEDPICVGAACRDDVAPPARSPAPQSALFGGPGNQALPAASGKPRIKSPRTVRGSRTKLRVTVEGPGRLAAGGPGLRSTSKTVTTSGDHTVQIALTSRAAATLRRTGRVQTTVRVTFTAKGARPAVARATVTFKRNSKQAKAKRSAA